MLMRFYHQQLPVVSSMTLEQAKVFMTEINVISKLENGEEVKNESPLGGRAGATVASHLLPNRPLRNRRR